MDIIAEQVLESEETIAVEDILLDVDVSMTTKAISEAITMDHREKLVEDWKIEADVQIAIVPGLNTPRDILDDVPDRNSHGQEDTINTLGVIGSTTSTLNMLTSTEILKTNQIQERKLIRTRQFKMEAVTEMEAPAFWREAQPSSATCKLETQNHGARNQTKPITKRLHEFKMAANYQIIKLSNDQMIKIAAYKLDNDKWRENTIRRKNGVHC